jgi:hypothetical protein
MFRCLKKFVIVNKMKWKKKVYLLHSVSLRAPPLCFHLWCFRWWSRCLTWKVCWGVSTAERGGLHHIEMWMEFSWVNQPCGIVMCWVLILSKDELYEQSRTSEYSKLTSLPGIGSQVYVLKWVASLTKDELLSDGAWPFGVNVFPTNTASSRRRCLRNRNTICCRSSVEVKYGNSTR